jgi:hypothetical protein
LENIPLYKRHKRMGTIWKSAEVRWFFSEAPEWLPRIFEALPAGLYSKETRTDWYLDTGEAGVGIKWRQGRLEIKRRKGRSREIRAGGGSGILEHWEKRSFRLEEASPQQSEPGWLAVKKKRWATLCRPAPEGFLLSVPSPEADPAMQLEYTRVSLGEASWHTFGLEWPESGIPGFPKPWEKLAEVLQQTAGPGVIPSGVPEGWEQLTPETSMGYPAFLERWDS